MTDLAAELRARAEATRELRNKAIADKDRDGILTHGATLSAYVEAASLVESAARAERRCSVCGKVPDGRPCEPASELDEDVARVQEWLLARILRRLQTCEKARSEAEARVGEYEQVLTLIATPKRPDGTYNRSREACEQLAREALEGEDG